MHLTENALIRFVPHSQGWEDASGEPYFALLCFHISRYDEGLLLSCSGAELSPYLPVSASC